MKKIINPWEGLDGYMCFGCAPSNPMGLHMEFYEDGDDIVAYWEVTDFRNDLTLGCPLSEKSFYL